MKILNLIQCPICLKDFDYRNMKTGVCRHCQYLIDIGDDKTLEKYFAIPLSQFVCVLTENEKTRLERK